MFDYEGLEGRASTPQMTFVVLLQTSILFAELMCYLFINVYIYIHNETMMKNSVITQDAYRYRKRSHAFSITHQMYQFIADMLFIILVNLAINFRSNNESYFMYELLLTFKDIGFGILTFVQVMTSSEIRTEFLRSVKKN